LAKNCINFLSNKKINKTKIAKIKRHSDFSFIDGGQFFSLFTGKRRKL